MNFSSVNTAILLFAKSPEHEAKTKNFLKNRKFSCNVDISKRLFIETHSKCIKAGLPVFHLDENEQKGSNFADRLKDALERVFAEGYEHVIAVGNDCPDLNVSDIEAARFALQEGNAVLGRTQKGGVYLMGLSQSDFEQFDLESITWQSSLVFKQLQKQFSAFTKTFLLHRKTEFNSQEDLKDFSNFLNSELSKWLFSQAARTPIDLSGFLSLVQYEVSEIEGRGPPVS
ncbi:MAG: DUF2064 domain-containing protein [Bacteroidota bacterium]